MRKRHIAIAFPLLLITGCQTATRPYDGVLGFKKTGDSKSGHGFFYVDEDRREWTEVEIRARKACAHSLDIDLNSTRLEIHTRTQFSQHVAMPVAVQLAPAGVSQAGPGSNSSQNPAGVVSQGSTLHHSFDREMKLKKIEGACAVASNP